MRKTEAKGADTAKTMGLPAAGVFSCRECGKCCLARGEYGYVYVNLHERRRLARYLGIDTAEFTRRYCARTDGWYHLKHPEQDCGFLRNNRCSVYAARPDQCRTWPFWPENMEPGVWEKEVVPYCPGAEKRRPEEHVQEADR